MLDDSRTHTTYISIQTHLLNAKTATSANNDFYDVIISFMPSFFLFCSLLTVLFYVKKIYKYAYISKHRIHKFCYQPLRVLSYKFKCRLSLQII